MNYDLWHSMTAEEQWEYVRKNEKRYDRYSNHESMLGSGNYVSMEQYHKIKAERNESRELCMAAAQRWLDHHLQVYDRTAVCVQMTYPRDSK